MMRIDKLIIAQMSQIAVKNVALSFGAGFTRGMSFGYKEGTEKGGCE